MRYLNIYEVASFVHQAGRITNSQLVSILESDTDKALELYLQYQEENNKEDDSLR